MTNVRNKTHPFNRPPLREQLRPYIPRDVPSTVCCLEKEFTRSVYRFFPGHGEQIIHEYEEYGHFEQYTDGRGDRLWVSCYRRLQNLLSRVSNLPYPSYVMEVTLSEYLMCVNDLVECTEKKIGASFGDTYDFENGFDEICERMLSIMRVLIKSNPRQADNIPFMKAPFTVYREACDEITKKYPSKTLPNFDRQSGYLHEHVNNIPYIAGRLDKKLDEITTYTFTTDFLNHSTLGEVLTKFDLMYDFSWTPDTDVGDYLAYEYTLWIWLYDVVLKPLMQAAAAFHHHRNNADRHPVSG